jgi:Domain of unknown function (DUF4412)
MRSTRLVLPAVALGAAVSVAGAQSRPVGWTYTTNMTIDSGDAVHRVSMAMRHHVMDGKVRMEFLQVSNMRDAAGAEGMYQIMNSADSTMTMVMPNNKMATVMNVAGMFAGRDATPRIATHMTKSQTEDLGAGDKILGHATHHIRVTSEGTIDVTMFGQSCTGNLSSVSEMWVAPDVDLRAAMEATSKTMSTAFGFGDDITPALSTFRLPSGTPLRTVSKATRLNAQGRSVTVTTTTEYVELAKGPLDPSLFAVPSDYHVMDMRHMMADLPAGMLDSAMNAGVAQGASSTTKAMCQSFGSP